MLIFRDTPPLNCMLDLTVQNQIILATLKYIIALASPPVADPENPFGLGDEVSNLCPKDTDVL